MEKWIGLIGLIGLFGLIGLRHRIPAGTPGGLVRLCGLFGLIGIGGFWIGPLGASGAFGALGIWNHPTKKFARLSRLGLLGIIGPLYYFTLWQPHETASDVADEVTAPAVEVAYSQDREACAYQQPHRMALFGDLHVHTAFSFDAYAYGVQTTPDDAYRYAKGESIPHLPLDDSGNMSGTARIDRPLDFVAVTDHAEYLGEVQLCTDEDSASYNTEYCQGVRGGGLGVMRMIATALALDPAVRISPICPAGDADCIAATKIPWQRTIEAADDANDNTSACSFTALVGYEYSGSPNSSNYHRNVIFRNSVVPDLPVSKFEASLDIYLWRALNKVCTDEMGCDYLTIPHNSNLSNGKMLTPYADMPDTQEAKVEYANARLEREPLLEIFQHKGNSECANGFPGILGAPDELCELEQIRRIGTPGRGGFVTFENGQLSYSEEQDNPTRYCDEGELGFGGIIGMGCLHPNDFYRTALLTGLSEQNEIGLNPVKLGGIASTDTHMTTAGGVDEKNWTGHIFTEWNRDGRLLQPSLIPSGKDGNPGGLTGVYAIENSRDAIFDALKRRETFGTSGPRISPRFFAGWNYEAGLCDAPDMLETAYADGVPMGADMSPAPSADATPKFLVSAVKDPASNATPLQKLQIVKGWIDADGVPNYKVFDVAGDADTEAGVNMNTGERFGDGHRALCTVFEDPEFDPSLNAYYYMKAVENPSPRWSLLDCVSYPADDRPDVCNNPRIAAAINEQAWTSPIWFTPE